MRATPDIPGTYDYIVCPLCSRNRIVQSKEKGLVCWDHVSLLTSKILQVRQQHPRSKKAEGKSKGFTLLREHSLTLPELMDRQLYPELVQGLKGQFMNLLKQLVQLNIISGRDIESVMVEKL